MAAKRQEKPFPSQLISPYVAGAISREYFVSAADHHERSRERQSRARKINLYSREFQKQVNCTRNTAKLYLTQKLGH